MSGVIDNSNNGSLPSEASSAPKDRPGLLNGTGTRVNHPCPISRQAVSDAWRAQMFTVLDGLEPRDPLLVSLWTAIFNAMTENSRAGEGATTQQQQLHPHHHQTADIRSSTSPRYSSAERTAEGPSFRNIAWKHSYNDAKDDVTEAPSSPSSSPAATACSRRSSASTAACTAKSVSFDDDVTFFD